ncbi:MAG: radical SAM/SPASM domain-containing protein [Planctomycetota bacterium]|jgi:sulfatase maturation enzyme AslB (radical SAM superfamily)
MKFLGHLSSKTACRVLGSAYDATRASFPPIVRVETTNACNAKCIICPHKEMQRPVRRMDDELFGRIIDECGENRCREVHLHNFGEPLIDKKLEDRVRFAKKRGIPKVKIFSNGSLLNEKRARGLIEAGLDEIKISFDGATREEFERIRAPLKFDTVVNNVKGLVALRNEMKASLTIRVACCSTSDRNATMQSLEEIVDGFSFGKVHNWAVSDAQLPHQGKVRKPCSRLWRTFTVLSGGAVSLCCLDYDGQLILGTLADGATIRDVWSGAAYADVRRRHKNARQAEIDLCNGCTKSFF